ncbi:hypothetical protein SAY87_001536 [Trapa incisa]|uniref:HMA domain-containing protein n=1 Tax=Trapa incisa TaxID=236973 RepID=A0AAN7GIN5_9MYRT|nr:hypothetical protein SAY87_001536 [Trapa incisa]
MEKRIVVKVSVGDETRRQKALEAVSKLKGIRYMRIDVQMGILVVRGGFDPVCVTKVLKKLCGGAAIDSLKEVPPPSPSPIDNMRLIVVRVMVGDETKRQKVLEAVAKLKGIMGVYIMAEKGTLTIGGVGVDPVCVIMKLRKVCEGATIDSVKDPPKKPAEEKDKDPTISDVPCCLSHYWPGYYGPIPPPYPLCYEEYNPNTCVIV